MNIKNIHLMAFYSLSCGIINCLPECICEKGGGRDQMHISKQTDIGIPFDNMTQILVKISKVSYV